jgi:exodeoxyribonuclease V beta subunit
MVGRLFATDAGTSVLQQVRWREGAWNWPDCTYHGASTSVLASPVVLEEPARAPYENRWSFSALTRVGRDGLFEEEPADHEDTAPLADDAVADVAANDAIGAAAATAAEPALLELAGLRGAEFGNALHAVFETRRIGVPLAEQRELIAHSLRAAGVRLGELPITTATARIATRLDTALAAELAPGLRLGEVPARRQRAEMEFHFALDEVSIRGLREVCARHGDATLVPPGIRASTLRGLMTGKIDLVFEHARRFHVLDYKSNDLGKGVDHSLDPYHPAALAAAMDEHHYRFQALLYTVAVDRYLRQRIPDYERGTHLGDAIYLFVRAAGLAPHVGVWRHRFDDALLDAVDAVLANDPSAEQAA